LKRKRNKFTSKKKYELAHEASKEIKVMREFISDPNKIFNKETIFQKVGESVMKNLWGGKASYYSSRLPEHSSMLKQTPLEGLALVPLSTDIILKNKEDKYKIPKNGEDNLIHDADELRRLEEMYNQSIKPKIAGVKPLTQPTDFDEEAIPIIMNNKEMQEELKRLQDEEKPKRYNLEAVDLDEETLAMAQPMIGVFGMDIMKKLFSADWHLREEALRDIEREVKLGSKSAL
jgi:hypothetical protein